MQYLPYLPTIIRWVSLLFFLDTRPGRWDGWIFGMWGSDGEKKEGRKEQAKGGVFFSFSFFFLFFLGRNASPASFA